MKINLGVVAAVVAAGGVAAHASTVTVTFENLLPSGGTAFTPVFVGLSGGAFDLFDPGSAASAGLEQVAELGSTGALAAEFAAADPNGVSGTTGGGPVLGGGSASIDLEVTNALDARFLSFASMVVPTNDLFVGNGNGIEVFDAAGDFVGPFTITIFGSQVWDAGTEVNNADNGAAFLQGIDGTAGDVEGGNVSLFFSDPDADSYLDSLLGRTTAPGFDIASTFGRDTAIARITVVPAPGAVAALGAAGVFGLRRRRA